MGDATPHPHPHPLSTPQAWATQHYHTCRSHFSLSIKDDFYLLLFHNLLISKSRSIYYIHIKFLMYSIRC